MHPILVHFGFFDLRSYAVLTAIGVVVSFMFLKTRQRRMGLRGETDYWALVYTLVASGFVGARLVGMIFAGESASTTFWRRLFAVEGNFSVFGLIAGVSAGTYLFSRVHKLPSARSLDYVAFCVPVWLAWGRLGCFLNGCCYGRPSHGRFVCSVTFDDPQAAMPRELLGVPLYPAQLYEAGGCIVLVGFLFVLLERTEKGRNRSGLVCVASFAGYGALRFIVEWFRGDSVPLPGTPLTAAHVFSLALIVGAALLLAGFSRNRRAGEPPSTMTK